MGKVIATVGVIVGAVALAATGIGAIAAPALAGAVSIGGVSASTLLLAGTALQAVGSALTKRPKLSTSSTERLNASLVTDTPRKIAFGRTALNTDLRYQEWWGKDQEYCSQVFVLASHHCEAVEEIWLDDKLAWTAASGVTAAFTGYFVVMTQPKAGAGSVFRTGWSNRWGANATFNGCATLYLQFKVTGNGKKGQSPFSSSITSRVTVVGKGALLPDPRFDSTVGGSGAVRMADQTTWGWSTAGYESGRNPALALLFYLLGWRIQDPATGNWKLAVGRGVPVDRIDLGSFITAANMCDEIVQRANGGSEPRYRCDGTFSEGDDPSQVIASLETCMNAKLRDSAGRFALQILHNDLATPIVDFTDDDVLGDFTWTAGNDLNDRRNVVRGRYTNPGSLYQLVDFPQVRLAPVDGIERIDSIDLALVQSPSQAQRLAKQRLQRQQYQGTFAAEFNARAWAVKDGDVVRLTFAALGFNRKLFRVAEGLIDTTGVVPLALVEEHADIYAWDRSEAPAVEAAEPNQFNPLLVPIIVAIDEAGKTAEWPAITGEGKPDDDATNSADPNSPFGPGGTVGGTLDSVAEAKRIAAEAKARQEALDNETIPAINAAVSDASERITATRKAADDGLAAADKKLTDAASRLDGEDAAIRRQVDAVQSEAKDLNVTTNARVTREVATLADADGALSRRIDSIVAEGGYDDTYVRAEITRVEQAYVTADTGISQRIDRVQSSLDGVGGLIDAKAQEITIAFTKGDQALASRASALEATAGAGGNLVPNSALSTLDGWSVNFNADNLTGLYLNLAGTPWMLGGVENNLTLFRAAAGNGLCAQALSSRFAVRGGSFVQFYAMTANHRCNVWTSLFFFRADGSDAGYAGENTSPRINEGGQNIAAWDTTGLKAVQVPADAVSACFAMRLYNVSNDGYAWFSRPFVTEVKQGATSWVAYSPGNDRSVTSAIGARVRTTEDALVDLPNRYATAQRASDIEASVGNVSGRVGSVETAVSDGRFATATRAEQIASYAGGIAATVDQQAGTIARLDGKAAAYVRFVALAGNNRAQLTLSADANGGAGADLIGDLSISGNLLVTGSVVGRNIAPDTISGTASREAGSATFRTTALTTIASVGYVGNGGRAAITFSGIVTLSPGAPAGTRMQAYLSVNGGIRVGPLPVSAVRGSPAPFCFATLIDVSGQVNIELSVQASGAPGSGDPHIVDNPTIILVEMKKLGG